MLHHRTYSCSHDTATTITNIFIRASIHKASGAAARKAKILCPAQYARQRILHHRTAVQGNRPQGRHQPPRIQTRLTDHKYAATPVPQSPRSRSLALLRGPAMRTRSMPLRSMPTPRLQACVRDAAFVLAAIAPQPLSRLFRSLTLPFLFRLPVMFSVQLVAIRIPAIAVPAIPPRTMPGWSSDFRRRSARWRPDWFASRRARA